MQREERARGSILCINGGSSSIKFALHPCGCIDEPTLSGRVERIGLPEARFTAEGQHGSGREERSIEAPDHRAATGHLLDWLEQRIGLGTLSAVGHRIVHGGSVYREPQRVTPDLLEALRRLSPYDPEHLPSEIDLVEAFRGRYPDLPQIVCFDTAFHRALPRVARILPIPRRYEAAGVQRYGFHGLSYAYLMEELARLEGERVARGRIVLAHLGNGASLAAVRGGASIDTTMAFTPAAGIPMSTRTGDLDPGIVWYLARTEQMSPERFQRMANHESGLLGMSETSSDIRDLLAREAGDPRAADAVAVFCYGIKKCIGAYAAALGGLDTLVFSAGIGENRPEIRTRACDGLAFLGIELDEAKNRDNAAVISTPASRVTVRVLHTREEVMIARAVCRLLGSTPAGEAGAG